MAHITERLELRYVVLSDVQPAARNPRTHDLATVRASIDRLGFLEPVLLDERTGRLIAGHGRLELLAEAEAADLAPPGGIDTDSVGRWMLPVIHGWASKDDDEAAAALVALNDADRGSGWDTQAFADLLGSLSDLTGTGWAAPDLDDLLASLQEADPGAPITAGDVRSAYTGAGTDKTFEQFGDNYRNRQVRSMVFDYPLDAYAEVAETAGRARKALGVESNAELFQALLRSWVEANPA